MKRAFQIVIVNLLIFLLLVVLAEGALFLLYRFPPDSTLRAARKYYRQHSRYNISYMEKCSQHHPDLTYTLSPGTCRFENLEFTSTVHANSMGLRDDEESLHKPEVIALGDSHTLGWGVEQNDIYTALLEQTTGLKILSAALASYGTARQMILLRQLDRSNLSTVLIQYCDNDLSENRKFVEGGGNLHTMEEEQYLFYRAQISKSSPDYTFGKLLKWYIPLIKKYLGEPIDPRPQSKRIEKAEISADYFVETLLLSRDLLEGKKIVVYEVNRYGWDLGLFTEALKAELQKRSIDWLDIEVLDTSTVLDPQRHFYRVDDHMTEAGHRALAEALRDYLPEPSTE